MDIKKLYKDLYDAGVRPVIQKLDNEASDGLINAIKKQST